MPTPLKFDSQDSFMLFNKDDHTLTFAMPNQRFVVEPTHRIFVPFDLIRIYFGDPRSVPGSRRKYEDSRGKGTIPAREVEIDRLKTLYGVYGEDQVKLEDRTPKIVIKTADGVEIIPPIYDRTGTRQSAAAPKTLTDIRSVQTLAAIIEQQQKQLDEMKRMMQRAELEVPNSDDIETDTVDEALFQE